MIVGSLELIPGKRIAAHPGIVEGRIERARHVGRLSAARREENVPALEFLRTHPRTAGRIAAVGVWAKRSGAAIDGVRRPLPPAIAAARTRGHREW